MGGTVSIADGMDALADVIIGADAVIVMILVPLFSGYKKAVARPRVSGSGNSLLQN